MKKENFGFEAMKEIKDELNIAEEKKFYKNEINEMKVFDR